MFSTFYDMFSNQRFRMLTVSASFFYFAVWMGIGALPVLVAFKFGTSTEIVITIALRILPRLLLAPVGGLLIHKFGAKTMASAGTALLAGLCCALPFAPNFLFLQLLVVLVGIADVAITPSFLTMRAAVIPEGKNNEANTVFQSVDRLAKIAGPAVAGLLIVTINIQFTFFVIALLMLTTSLLVAAFMSNYIGEEDADETSKAGGTSIMAVLSQISRTKSIYPILIPSLAYMVMLGALQPFLFWLNIDKFGNQAETWTFLLAAQGLGAILGAIVAGFLVSKLAHRYSLLHIFLIASLLEGLFHALLIFTVDHLTASIVLILAGIPEMVAFVVYFTITQKILSSRNLAMFYSLSLPLFDLFLVLGILLTSLYSAQIISLNTLWLIAVGFSIVPIFPFFFSQTLFQNTRTTDENRKDR